MSRLRKCSRIAVSGTYFRGWVLHNLTLPRKLEAVQRKTTTRSRRRPSVCRATPLTTESVPCAPSVDFAKGIEENVDGCSSTEGSRRLSGEWCMLVAVEAEDGGTCIPNLWAGRPPVFVEHVC